LQKSLLYLRRQKLFLKNFPTLQKNKNTPTHSPTKKQTMTVDRRPAGNSTYPKGGVSCSKDSFVVNQTLVFQIKFCGKSPALRVAAKRCVQASNRIKELNKLTKN